MESSLPKHESLPKPFLSAVQAECEIVCPLPKDSEDFMDLLGKHNRFPMAELHKVKELEADVMDADEAEGNDDNQDGADGSSSDRSTDSDDLSFDDDDNNDDDDDEKEDEEEDEDEVRSQPPSKKKK
ncbi:hypothetical protein UlMin_009547 [Ulmus minor]